MADPSTSFGEAAIAYANFRPDYPPSVFEFLFANLRSGRHCAVDLGAGSGQATRRLASVFDKVIAVEHDQRLISAAILPPNVTVQETQAETAKIDRESIDAVISATAFHWMDQPGTCSNVIRWLKPGGVFFPFSLDVFRVEGPAQEYFENEYKKWRPFRDRRLDEHFNYETALINSGHFDEVISFSAEVKREMTPEAAAGFSLSVSFARAYAATLDNQLAYFKSIHDYLLQFGEKITFVFPIVGALGRKG
jgi:SAM-dependent methyltransferase